MYDILLSMKHCSAMIKKLHCNSYSVYCDKIFIELLDPVITTINLPEMIQRPVDGDGDKGDKGSNADDDDDDDDDDCNFVICLPTQHLGVLKNSLKRVRAFQIEFEFESVGF